MSSRINVYERAIADEHFRRRVASRYIRSLDPTGMAMLREDRVAGLILRYCETNTNEGPYFESAIELALREE